MDLRKIPLFDMMARRLNWIGQRQQVLATNIANADTPGYKPRDVKSLDFATIARGHMGPLAPAVTNPKHMVSTAVRADKTASEKEKEPIETTISGNAVTLEQELMKASKNMTDYELTTNLYRKHLTMFKDALRTSN